MLTTSKQLTANTILTKNIAGSSSCDIFYFVLDVLLNCLACFLSRNRRRNNYVDSNLFNELIKLGNERVKSCKIVLADLQCRIYKHIGNVVVASQNSCEESVQRLCIRNKILLSIDESCAVLNVIAELYALLDANNVSVRVVYCGI